MIDPSENMKYILRNWNPGCGQNDIEFFDTLEQVTEFVNANEILPDDFTVYEVAKEIKFKLVPT